MRYDAKAIRSEFPALSIHDDGVPRIYFDNPAGTQVSQSVVDAMSSCMLESNANLGGYFPTSEPCDSTRRRSTSGNGRLTQCQFAGRDNFRPEHDDTDALHVTFDRGKPCSPVMKLF